MADNVINATYSFEKKSCCRVGTNADYVAGGNFNIFTIQNYCIVVHQLFGHVTAAFTGAVPTILLRFTPTAGAGISSIATVSVGAAHALGTLLTWSGLAAGVLTPLAAGWSDAGTATNGFAGGTMNFIPGVISVTNAGGADATACIDWYIVYTPAGPGASVVAA